MKAAGLTPRAVPRDKYIETVKALPQNISELYKRKIFDDIRLFDRNKNCIYKYSEQPNTDPKQIFEYKLNEFSKERSIVNEQKPFSQGIEDLKERARKNETDHTNKLKPNNPKH